MGADLRLVALLAWYDEDADHLAATATSLARIGVDVLVAVDGRYETFAPGAPAASGPEQHAAIRLACAAAGISCAIHTPSRPWASEIEKRTFMFRLGERHRPDWYLVIDGDEVVETDLDVKSHLASTGQDAAVVTLDEPGGRCALRMFFRAIPGLAVKGNHHSYFTPDGRKLWGGHPMEPAHDLRDLVVLHRPRAKRRRDAATDYYRRRDADGLELDPCIRCGEPGDTSIPGEWRETDGGLTSIWLSVCNAHKPEVRQEQDAALRAFGLDPALIRVSFRRMEETFA